METFRPAANVQLDAAWQTWTLRGLGLSLSQSDRPETLCSESNSCDRHPAAPSLAAALVNRGIVISSFEKPDDLRCASAGE